VKYKGKITSQDVVLIFFVFPNHIHSFIQKFIYPKLSKSMTKQNIALLILLFCVSIVSAQNDEVLFTVGDDMEVPVSEFKYIYEKTNAKDADFSKKSLDEYLDLYKKFKLKVKKAREMGLDAKPAFVKELGTYRRQLSNTYLTDKEVSEKLVREAYERSKEDVEVEHIMIKIVNNDTLKAYEKVVEIQKELAGGADFNEVARKKSQHASRKSGGKLGYMTVLQLPDLYNFENAVYDTPIGQVSAPVRTNTGYHLIKPVSRRPAKGELDAAHILIRISDKMTDEEKTAAETKIKKLHQQLKAGADFATLARANSDDKITAANGGIIPRFGINTYDVAFENAAFDIKKDGDMTEPVLSTIGWHIIKRIGKPDMSTFEGAKPVLLGKVKKDARFTAAEDAVTQRIKREAGFKFNEANKTAAITTLGDDKNFLKHNWKVPKTADERPLFTMDNETASVNDFHQFLIRERNARLQMKRSGAKKAAENMLEKFVAEKAIEYEKTNLENKYPEFKALMREYEEGILLFEATKIEVWDKASKDEEGLKAFYEKNKTNYTWNERAKVTTYTVNTTDPKIIAKVSRLACKKSAATVLKKVNKKAELVTTSESTVERDSKPVFKNLKWKAGTVADPVVENNKASIIKIEELLAPEQKPFDKARGYVVADYQEELEKQWVADLAEKFPIKVKQEVYKKLVK